MRRGAFVALLALPLAIAPAAASAGSYARDDVVDTCELPNCEAQVIQGYFQPEEPFVMQVYALTGECLRLAVTAQGVDTRMYVISPETYYYSWDDNSGGNNLPLIRRIVSTTGYHTVIIGPAGYVPPSGASITLRYGRYDTGNANCK